MQQIGGFNVFQFSFLCVFPAMFFECFLCGALVLFVLCFMWFSIESKNSVGTEIPKNCISRSPFHFCCNTAVYKLCFFCFFFKCFFNSLNAKVFITWKAANWFAVQVNLYDGDFAVIELLKLLPGCWNLSNNVRTQHLFVGFFCRYLLNLYKMKVAALFYIFLFQKCKIITSNSNLVLNIRNPLAL